MGDVPLLGEPPKPGRYVKVSIFLKKRPDLTDDYFNAYWYHNHTVLFLKSKAFQTYVRKYNQSHYYKDQAQANANILGLPTVEFDGVAEFWVDTLDDWQKLWQDPEFTKALEGDNEKFIGPLQATAGYDYLFLDNSESTVEESK